MRGLDAGGLADKTIMERARAILGTLLISLSAVWVKLSGVSPDTSAFFRSLYAVPVLYLLVRVVGVERRSSRDRLLAFGAGILLGLDLTFWHRSIHWIGAGLSTVLGNTQVVVVGLAAWLIHGERPRPILLRTLPLVILGIVMVSGLGRQDSYGEDPLKGAVFGALTAVTYGAFILLLRFTARSERFPLGTLFDATLGAAAAAAIVGALTGGLDLAIRWPAHGWLVALALGSQVAGWLLITTALPRLPALEASVLLLLQPAAAVLWGVVLFREGLSVVQWLGVLLILGGVAVVSLRGAARKRPS